MNQPDPDLIEALEEEYMEPAAAGDGKAIDYALAESEQFNGQVLSTLMTLMRVAGPESSRDPESSDQVVSIWAQGARCELLTMLADHVAPVWALVEYPKRIAATEEMVAEWAAEAA